MRELLDQFAIIKPTEHSLLLNKLVSLAQFAPVDWPQSGAEGLWNYGKAVPWDVLMVNRGDKLVECFELFKVKPPETLLTLQDTTGRILKGSTAATQRHLIEIMKDAGVAVFNEEVSWAIIINHSGVVSFMKENHD